MVLGPAERLDPLSRGQVFDGARGARYLPVRDVANEQVPERVLGLSLDRGPARTLHKLLALQPEQRLLRLGPSIRRQTAPSQKTFPTTAASWRSAFSASERWSSRAAMIPCTVSGSASSSSEPRSASILANCSA